MLADFYRQQPPAMLSHYTDSTGLLGILRERALWATHIRFLNDAREFIHAIDIAKAYVKELQQASTSPTRTNLLVNLADRLDVMPGNTFVISFSEESDLLSQWRGYCSIGGYSLGFDSERILQLADQQRFVLVKCEYERAAQVELIRTLIDEAEREFRNYLPPAFYAEPLGDEDRARVFAGTWFFPKMQRLASAMKDPAFREEREWRLVGGLFQPLPPLAIRTRESLLVPYQILRLESDPTKDFEGVIGQVIIGPNSNQTLAHFGVERLQQCNLIKGLKIEVSKAPFRIT